MSSSCRVGIEGPSTILYAARFWELHGIPVADRVVYLQVGQGAGAGWILGSSPGLVAGGGAS